MKFYVHADDQTQQIGPLSLGAAQSIVRATALAQRSAGSRVWVDRRGRLFVQEAGCALSALWVTDELNRVVNIDVAKEFGTRRQQLLRRVRDRIETAVRRRRLHN